MTGCLRYLPSSLLAGAVGSGLPLGWHEGLLAHVWSQDSLYICVLTVAVFALCFVASLWRPYMAAAGGDLCAALGFLGTVLGFIIMLNGLGSSPDAAWGLHEGLAIALYTTAVGLICTLILYVHGLLLGERR